ncbi:MAG: hypothetical protein JRI92_11385, partial [Deltaproteobacteria bacterium]|nr:hypothetical protein [Deltaproteobacteria bacterium]
TEAVRLSAIFGTASADETAAGQDDDLGYELDLKLKWSFYEGALTYSAVAAYLAAGDYWEGVTPPADPDFNDSCYALYHNITLSF